LRWLSRLAFLKPAVTWIERHADKKGNQVRKYSLLGLFILVAIPLPGTGVWTGSLVAAVLDLRIKHALPVIFLGNIVASFCILLLTGFSSGNRQKTQAPGAIPSRSKKGAIKVCVA
jgi:uncharacterized membrane protein